MKQRYEWVEILFGKKKTEAIHRTCREANNCAMCVKKGCMDRLTGGL